MLGQATIEEKYKENMKGKKERERYGMIYSKWWKGRNYNQEYSMQKDSHSDFTEKSKALETKVQRIQHHQTSFTINAKGTSLSRKHKRRERSTKNKSKTIKKNGNRTIHIDNYCGALYQGHRCGALYQSHRIKISGTDQAHSAWSKPCLWIQTSQLPDPTLGKIPTL